MQKKSSVISPQNHPRIPPERDGIQVNHCKSPVCPNYGVAAGQTSVRGSNSYILDSRNKGISCCICTSCGVEFPLKSNIGITEEVERMATYLLPPDVVCCRNDACVNHTNQVPVGTVGAYASFGKTAIVKLLTHRVMVQFEMSALQIGSGGLFGHKPCEQWVPRRVQTFAQFMIEAEDRRSFV